MGWFWYRDWFKDKQAEIDPLLKKIIAEKVPEEILYKPKPYVEPTDKEMIEGLEMCGYYAEACRIQELKKEVANLKRKLTILKKKYETE